MRINKFLASYTELSRRAADAAVADGLVKINGVLATNGQDVLPDETVEFKGQTIEPKQTEQLIVLLNKPTGYVCSQQGQGAKTIFELLPKEYQNLKIAGRLDKDSSGLVVLTNDGQLVQQLAHPSAGGQKLYEIELDKALSKQHLEQIKKGVNIGEDRLSKMQIEGKGKNWQVSLQEGRNRQIRRSFDKLGYTVTKLHRTQLKDFLLGSLKSGTWQIY